MAETQKKRLDDTIPENANDNSSSNAGNKNNATQNNQQAAGNKDTNNSQNKNNTGGDSSIDTKDIIQQAKKTAGQAYEKVTEQASTQISAQKDNLAHSLASVANNIKQMGENLRGEKQDTPIAALTAKYGDSLATQVQQISNYLEKNDLGDLIEDVEVFARRNPAVFIGGAFALGIALARFLKSSSPNGQSLIRRSSHRRKGVYIPGDSEGVYLPEDLSKKVGLTGDSTKNSTTNASSDTAATTSNKTSSDDFSTK